MCEQHSSPTHYSAQNNLGPEPSSLMKSPPSQKSFPESSAPHCTLDFGTFIVSVIVRLLYPWDCKLSYSRAWASTQHLSTQEFTSIHMNEINTDSLITESGGLFHPSSKTLLLTAHFISNILVTILSFIPPVNICDCELRVGYYSRNQE